MAYQILHLKTGQVLICDFNRGFVAPEMLKVRPVVVISKSSTHYRQLCTVVPLSTTAPNPVQPWHVKLSCNPLPYGDQSKDVWAKCDMIQTVCFDRMSRPHNRVGGQRKYHTLKLGAADLGAVFDAVKSYLP